MKEYLEKILRQKIVIEEATIKNHSKIYQPILKKL